MTDKQIEGFHIELAKLMNKYGLRGLVGMGFVNEKESGIIQLYDPTDSVLKGIIEYTRTMLVLTVRENGGYPGKVSEGVAFGDGKNN